MELLASFDFNNKKYALIVEGDIIKYCCIEGDVVSYNLTKDEISMCDQVKSKIMISTNNKDYINCGNINYNNKTFNIVFDKATKKKFFYEFDGKDYKFPSEEEYLYLDKNLNPTVWNAKENNFIKRNLICGAAGGVAGGIVVSLCMGTWLHVNEQRLFSGKYADTKAPTISVDETIEAPTVSIDGNVNAPIYGNNDDIQKLNIIINNNPNLTEDEKTLLKNQLEIYADDVEYINFDYMYDRLGSVDFSYTRDYNTISNDDEYKYTDAYYGVGQYDPTTNVVTLPESDINNYIFTTHEIAHLMFSPEVNSFGYMTHEAVTTIFDLEKNGGDLSLGKGSYQYERNMVYMLIELLGVDTFKKYYYGGGDINVLKNELNKIINDQGMADAIIAEIDVVRFKYDNILKSLNTKYFTSNDELPATYHYREVADGNGDYLASVAMKDFFEMYNCYWVAKYNCPLEDYSNAGIYRNFYSQQLRYVDHLEWSNQFDLQQMKNENNNNTGIYGDVFNKVEANKLQEGHDYYLDLSVIPRTYFVNDDKKKESIDVKCRYYWSYQNEYIVSEAKEAYYLPTDCIQHSNTK